MKIFDCHADIGVDVYTKHQQGLKDIIKTHHLEKWKKGQVYGCGMASFFEGSETLETAKAMVMQLRQEIMLNDKDLYLMSDGNLDSNKINALMTLEGMCFIKDEPEVILNWMYEKGIRIGSLTWNDENDLATGISGNPCRGLTDLGKRAIHHMNQIRMIVDVSHTNEKSFWDILDVSTRPIIATHSNARALSQVDRNLSDQQIKAIALKGGLIGLVSAPPFISLNPDERTALTLAKHALYIKNLVGVDVLCIGFDYMDFFSGYHRKRLDLNDASESQDLVKALYEVGFSVQEVEKICWGNITDFLKKEL